MRMGAARFTLSGPAAADIAEILDYVEQVAGPSVAEAVRDDIRDRLRRLAQHPGLGHSRSDLTRKPVLFSRVHSWLVIYRPGKAGIEVVRVLHAARDVKELLDES